MLDLARLTGLVGDLFGETTDRPEIGDITDQLGALGIDPATLEGMDAQQILETLQAQGIDLTGLDPSELVALGSQTGLDGIVPALVDRITDRAA